MLLVIDNYDSFIYNLVQYFGELGCEVLVKRNDEISAEGILRLKPEAICISPGPKTPNEAGNCLDIIAKCYREVPILGVCLGHQCLGQAFGAKVAIAPKLLHGKKSKTIHENTKLFNKIPSPFDAGRYHSLHIENSENNLFQDNFVISAKSDDGVIMAIEHREFPVFGVQFHPESILTSHGKQLLKNFLALV